MATTATVISVDDHGRRRFQREVFPHRRTPQRLLRGVRRHKEGKECNSTLRKKLLAETVTERVLLSVLHFKTANNAIFNSRGFLIDLGSLTLTFPGGLIAEFQDVVKRTRVRFRPRGHQGALGQPLVGRRFPHAYSGEKVNQTRRESGTMGR